MRVRFPPPALSQATARRAVDDLPQIHPKTIAEWRRWLCKKHDKAHGVWLLIYRASTGKPLIDYERAVIEALTYGWIDSLTRKLDDRRSAQLFTPRRAGSGWSRTNKERIRVLMREGRMRPAGLAKIAAAKRDSSWALLDSVEALEIPRDLARALGTAGTRAFKSLARSRQKQHLQALVAAKRAETRAKRIAAIAKEIREAARSARSTPRA